MNECRIQQKPRLPHLLLHMSKKLTDGEVLDHVRVHLERSLIARARSVAPFTASAPSRAAPPLSSPPKLSIVWDRK